MSKTKRVFSGTRATGRLHLGNYLGAIKGYLELTANPDYECIFMVMDLHAITTPYDHQTLTQASKEIILDYLAAGLNPEKAIITSQSLVSAHPYLAYLFSSVMTMARMQHLPTFKEKAEQYPENVTMALLGYPILMAADILVYKAQLVPVGIDQEPHLEVAREVARKMNDRFGLNLPEPQRFATAGEYVPSLKGEGKMSKSVEGSYINLTDSLEEIHEKLKGAPTDSGKGQIETAASSANTPKTSVASKVRFIDGDTNQESIGVANILTLVELFEGEEKRQHYHQLYQGEGIRYGQLKEELAQSIYQELAPIQERRNKLENQPEYIDKIIADGAKKAEKIANQNLQEIQQAMGLFVRKQ